MNWLNLFQYTKLEQISTKLTFNQCSNNFFCLYSELLSSWAVILLPLFLHALANSVCSYYKLPYQTALNLLLHCYHLFVILEIVVLIFTLPICCCYQNQWGTRKVSAMIILIKLSHEKYVSVTSHNGLSAKMFGLCQLHLVTNPLIGYTEMSNFKSKDTRSQKVA